MKHAFLIMAHNEFDILEKLIRLLDDERNDLYIHIDKKVTDFPFEKFRDIAKHSDIYYTPRFDVRWGDFSLTLCQLAMFKAAVERGYRYYHLLSGVDLPLKTMDELHSFFAVHDGKEFIHFCTEEQTAAVVHRVERYHFMRLRLSRKIPERIVGYGITAVARVIHMLGFRRKWESGVRLAYGSNWCSITHALASYIVEKEDWIHSHFRLTCISDEHYIQTLVENSEFRHRLYRKEKDDDRLANMRYIDWTRGSNGSPYVFRMEDYDTIMASPCFFARKFSAKVDPEIIDRIYAHFRKVETE